MSRPRWIVALCTAVAAVTSVVVSAPSPVMTVIEKVLKDLDSDPIVEDTMFIYNLKNGQAQNLAIVLNALFGTGTGAGAFGGGTFGGNRTTTGGNAPVFPRTQAIASAPSRFAASTTAHSRRTCTKVWRFLRCRRGNIGVRVFSVKSCCLPSTTSTKPAL